MSNLKNIITETINNFLAESASAFHGCEDLAREALFHIRHHWCDDYQGAFSIDVPWGKGYVVFFPTNARVTAGYCVDHKQVNGDFAIGINYLYFTHSSNEDRQLSILMHELTHAYEDAKRMSSKSETIKGKMLRQGYQNLLYPPLELGWGASMLSAVLYFLTSFEVNAFMAGMNGYISSCPTPLRTPQECLKRIYHSREYQRFSKVVDDLDDLIFYVENEGQKYDEEPDYIEPNNFEQDFKDMLFIANKFSGRKFTNPNQLSKYLKWQQENIIDKVDNKIVRKIVGQFYERISQRNRM